ncbi:MAG: hypothetical protein ACJ8DC_09690 [Gemmatimonadales bacterium]
MSQQLLIALVVIPTALVVIALFAIMWRERASPRSAWIAGLSGIVLAGWASTTAVLASSGAYEPPDTQHPPPVGIQLVFTLALVGACLWLSPTLRGLLRNQKNLIRLNVWRLEGALFLALMFTGQMPPLWAVPAGVGDVLIGASAFWVAARLDAPGGRRRAIIFNLLGLLDLVVAIGLGITVNPGRAQVFHTTPTAELLTRFPLALVPGFLVPLAFTVHFVSLWHLRATHQRHGVEAAFSS